MHESAMKFGKLFFETYCSNLANAKVMDIGSFNANGSLRDVCPSHLNYIGVDLQNGNGVDVVLDDPYYLPFDTDSVDVIVSSSVLEHTEMFWLLFLEIVRILKPNGLFYLNVPSNGNYHRYPVDCWRFYPDSGNGLVNWAKRNNYQPILLESFIGHQDCSVWNDYIAVFLKDRNFITDYNLRMTDTYKAFTNGLIYGESEVVNFSEASEDSKKNLVIHQISGGHIKLK